MNIELFYDIKDKQFKGKALNRFTKHWYSLGVMDETASQKFVTYVRDKVCIGRREEPNPDLNIVLNYLKEWKKLYYAKSEK